MRVSVVMCTFNGAAHVEDQLTSVLNQSVPVDELVIADDGSSDGTLAKALDFLALSGSSLPRVSVMYPGPQTLGVAANFERALRSATGDFVFLADQDDVWYRDRVESALAIFDQSPDILAVASDADLIDARGNSLDETVFSSMNVPPSECRMLDGAGSMRALLRRNVIPGMALAVHRRLLEQALPIPGDWMHDYWLLVAAAALGRLRLAEKPLVEYRQHDANVLGVGSASVLKRIGRGLGHPNDSPRRARMFADLDAFCSSAPGVRRELRAEVARKAAFEQRRAAMSSRLRTRFAQILAEERSGSYEAYASSGRLSALQDLVNPPKNTEDSCR